MEATRLGVFGGAFDPPHNAHVALAKTALEQFNLNALYIIPTGQAWHKSRVLSSPEHRLAMTRLAFENIPRVVVDDRELQRTGPTFTIDTLQVLQAEHPQAQMHLFIGADQFVNFKQWRRWREILDIAIICIANRPQATLGKAQFDAYAPLRHRFFTLELPLMPISATQIRKSIFSGVDTASENARFVPESVARYISIHHLYRAA